MNLSTQRRRILAALAAVSLVGAILVYVNFNTIAPALADWGRAVLGAERVAQAETVFFRLTDWWQQSTYDDDTAGIPAWGSTPIAANGAATATRAATATTQAASATATPTATASPTATPSPSATATTVPPTQSQAESTVAVATATMIPPTFTATATLVPPTFTATVVVAPPTALPLPPAPVPSGAFPPAAIPPYLTTPAEGEGIWSPLTAAGVEGENSPLRYTFYRPDPARPYAYVALVAVDLTRVRLGLVAGTKEPASAVSAPRPGTIPAADLIGGQLLATFNGGFKAANGNFGMMTDGTEWLPPLQYHGTIALHSGQVSMGDWGVDMQAFPAGTTAWRQTPPLLVRDGALHPELSGGNAYWWGTTIDNDVVTWRSGMGLSADGQTLYYGVGPALSAEALARAFVAAGASDAAELDINAPYVRFLTYDTALTPNRLLTDMVSTNTHYISADERDFFYLAWW